MIHFSLQMKLISFTTLLSTLLNVVPHVLGGDKIDANSGPELDTAQLLKALVIRGNFLSSAGQFAKTYTEAIELVPTRLLVSPITAIIPI
jgi:hypothetical protein